MAFTGKFLGWFGSASAGCEHDRLGSSSDRRAVIGEGADAGNGIFGGTGHRGTREHEGEGKDEAEGPHQIVSVLAAGAARRFVGRLITCRCFRISAPKAGNGFVAGRFVSSAAARRNNCLKS